MKIKITLLNKLKLLTVAQLEELIFLFGMPHTIRRPNTSLMEQAIDLIHYAENQKRLSELSEMLQFVTSPNNEEFQKVIVDLSHLPHPSTALQGRQTELKKLDAAFDDPNVIVASIIAPGGVGKSALIDEWLQHMSYRQYGGALRVFAWSFYSQGSDRSSVSSTLFFQKALSFFSSENKLLEYETEKGHKLSEFLMDSPFILILDGLEPLQHPLHFLDGSLKDREVNVLFNSLRRMRASSSLVLVSSRQRLYEFYNWRPERYCQINLETLDSHTGAAILKHLNVQGKAKELQTASDTMGGHALALTLLGKMLATHYQGNVHCINNLPDFFSHEDDTGYAIRVMKWYEKYWSSNSLEITFLKVIGLFERPMTETDLELLLLLAKIRVFIRNHNYSKVYTKMIKGDIEYFKQEYPDKCGKDKLKNINYVTDVADKINILSDTIYSVVRNENTKLHDEIKKIIQNHNLNIKCIDCIIDLVFEHSGDFQPEKIKMSEDFKVFNERISLLENFVDIPKEDFTNILINIRQLGLVLPQRENIIEWDVHPLVRTFFGKVFQEEFGEDKFGRSSKPINIFADSHKLIFFVKKDYLLNKQKMYSPEILEQKMHRCGGVQFSTISYPEPNENIILTPYEIEEWYEVMWHACLAEEMYMAFHGISWHL